MSQAKLLIYDDGRGGFGPLTDLRAILHVRSGATDNRRRIERALGRPADALAVPARLADVERARHPDVAINPASYAGDWLAVNGRWVGLGEPPPNAVTTLPGARVPEFLANVPDITGPTILARPWHLLDQLEATLAADLAAHPGPRVAASARVHPSAILDESLGPVVIGEHAVVEPLAVIQGPAYVGPHSVVRTHANLRPHTSLGPHCRVGGEVSFTLIDGYSNKSHLGFLGHAVLGRWVNLGADTNCSNLKNTYDSVRVHLKKGEPPQDTGRMFLGPVIGDHVKTAIGTRINTGSVLGTGSMIVTTAFTPTHLPALSFLTDAGCRPYDVNKVIATAHAAFARRNCKLHPAEEQLLRSLQSLAVRPRAHGRGTA